MFEEDFSKWDTGALVTVPPETLEYVDLVGLAYELQNRLATAKEVYDAALLLASHH